jgi:hypothetical protein
VPPAAVSARDYSAERLGTESSVDDLGTCRAVVLSRAATILRSIETQASTGRFVLVREQLSAIAASAAIFILCPWLGTRALRGQVTRHAAADHR